jgi:hypothetical protein
MKKAILLILILSVSFITKVNSQNLKKDCEFYKATTHLLTAISSLDDIKNDNTEKDKALPIIKANVIKIENSYNLIEEQYKNDIDFKEFELWVQVIRVSYEKLQDDDIMWQMSYYLVKLNILDFVNQKY